MIVELVSGKKYTPEEAATLLVLEYGRHARLWENKDLFELDLMTDFEQVEVDRLVQKQLDKINMVLLPN